MGSLHSPPTTTQPPSPSENSVAGYRLYASYCKRKPAPDSNTSTWLEYYDPSNKKWVRLGSVPGLPENHFLKAFAMVTIGDSIYIIGGRICVKEGGVHGTTDDDDVVNEVDIEVLPTVSRYDISNDVWSNCAPLGTPRFDFACTVHDSKIYVAGGQCTLASARGISSAEVYDPDLDKWTPLPNMSTLRYKCVGVTWQGKIYVVGGFAEKGDSDQTVPFTIRSSAEMLDTLRGEWDLVMGMWQLDVPPNQIVKVGDQLFSSGDCLNTWKGHIEAYDGMLHIWRIVNGSHLPTLSSLVNNNTQSDSDVTMFPLQMLYLTMAPIGTHLYFIAGYRKCGENSRFISVVHRFDTSATGDPWRSFEPMEEEEEGDKELCSHCCVVVHQVSS